MSNTDANTNTNPTDSLPAPRAKNVALKANGLTGFWDFSGDFVQSKVYDALCLIGAGAYAPRERTALASLKIALSSLFVTRGKVGHAIVPTKDGYTIIQHKIDADTREVEKPVNIAKAWLERENQTGALTIRVEDCLNPANSPALHSMVVARSDAASKNVDSTSVSEALVEVVRDLCGLSLRSKGGVYWMPADVVESWNTLADAIEKATVPGAFAGVYSMTNVGDARTVRSIVAAFVREADAKMQEVEARIASGEISPEDAAKEARGMIDLASLAEHYETTLDTSLADIKTRIGEVQYRASQMVNVANVLASESVAA